MLRGRMVCGINDELTNPTPNDFKKAIQELLHEWRLQ